MGTLLLFTTLVTGQPAPDAFVAVSPAEGRPVGRLTKLTPGHSAELATADGVVTVTDVVSLRRVGAVLPVFPRAPGILTTAGDRVTGRLVGGDTDILRFQPAGAGVPWDVPIPSVAVAWLATPPAGTLPDPDRVSWLGPTRKRDVLRLRNGDITPGTVAGFSDEAVRFKPDAGDERVVPLDTVGAVAFNPALASARRPKGAYRLVVLRDGTRLHLTATAADEATLRGKTLFGQPVELSLGSVVAIDAVRGKATDLASLKPKVGQGGFLGVTWPWAADRTIRGEPLRLLTANGVETFDHGVGTHPKTVLTYELAGKYRRFEALVGLDPVSGRHGRAVVRIAVDGSDATPSGLTDLRPGQAVPVRVELAGAKQLTLTVDFGPAGDVQADVNWADARLFE